MSKMFFFVKQKTAYEMRISDWSSDVCSSDLLANGARLKHAAGGVERIDGGVDAEFRDRTVQNGRGVQVRERGRRRGVGQIVGGDVDRQIGRASCRERVCQYV